jgi:GNAT superfamily N-acetyltransferase
VGLAYTVADLAAEAGQFHFAGYVDGKPTASAVLQWIAPGVARMRQVAVRPDIQRQGLGRLTVEAFEAEAERRGAGKIVLHARRTSVAFYLRLRYEMTGELFEEIGLPHCRTHKPIAGGEVAHIPVSPSGG